MTEPSPRPWRTGNHVGRTIYRQDPNEPRGVLIGVMDTPEDAALVVAAVNAVGELATTKADVDVVAQPDGSIKLAVQDVELTPEQLAEFRARFEAARHKAPEVLWPVTRKELHAVIGEAYLLGRLDENEDAAVKGDDDVVHTIVERGAHSTRVLWAVGIPVQEGEQHD